MASVSELRADDIPQLQAFIVEAWQLAGPSMLGWTGATDENIREIASESFLRELVANPRLRVFVSRIDDDIVGFCATRRLDTETVELAGLVVRQNCLGKGVGSGLFEEAKKAAVASGFAAMIVKTESTNKRALLFYAGKGFVEQGQLVEKLDNAKVSLSVLKLELKEM